MRKAWRLDVRPLVCVVAPETVREGSLMRRGVIMAVTMEANAAIGRNEKTSDAGIKELSIEEQNARSTRSGAIRSLCCLLFVLLNRTALIAKFWFLPLLVYS